MKLKITKPGRIEKTPFVNLTIKTDFNDCNYKSKTTKMSVEDFDFISDIILDMLDCFKNNKGREYPLKAWLSEQREKWNVWCEEERDDYNHPFGSLIECFPSDYDYEEGYENGHRLVNIDAVYYDGYGVKYDVVFEKNEK